MTIALTTLRELVGQVGGLSDTALQLILDAEDSYITSVAPDADDNELRDSVLVDLIKNKLAYDGYASSSIQGFSGSWENRRSCIVDILLPSIEGSSGTANDNN